MLNTSPVVREPANPSGSGTKKGKENEWDLKEKSQEKGLHQPPQVRRTHKPHRNPALSLRILSAFCIFFQLVLSRLSKGPRKPEPHTSAFTRRTFRTSNISSAAAIAVLRAHTLGSVIIRARLSLFHGGLHIPLFELRCRQIERERLLHTLMG